MKRYTKKEWREYADRLLHITLDEKLSSGVALTAEEEEVRQVGVKMFAEDMDDILAELFGTDEK